MPKLSPGELSKHKTKGCRLTCGWYVGPDRKRRPKIFWLGQQKDRASLTRRSREDFGFKAPRFEK